MFPDVQKINSVYFKLSKMEENTETSFHAERFSLSTRAESRLNLNFLFQEIFLME
jgi:hypothetical protein